jgi:drug/metabolite transporter, DME family
MGQRGHTVPFGASLVALGSGVVWSIGAVNARLAENTDAFQYLLYRSIGVLVVIEAFSLLKGRPLALPRALFGGPRMLAACFFLFLASMAFVYAVKTTTPANAAFLGSLTPLFATIIAVGVLHERLGPVTIGALVLALIGLVVTVVGDLEAGNMAGNVAAVLASVGFAGYTICVRSDAARDWSPVMSGYAFGMIIICTAICLATGATLLPPARDVSLAIVHGGVLIVGGTSMFNWASRRVGTVAMTVFAQSEMVFIPLWSLLVLGLRPTAVSVVGGVIIFVAVIGKAIVDALWNSGEATEPDPVGALS